jgi:serine/threonine protein phosphatase PrpC
MTSDPYAAADASSAVEGDSDHFVLRPCPWAGGVSDTGRTHPDNQDSLAIAAGSDAQHQRAAVVAVSDGVSTSTCSAKAATIAARQAAACMADALATCPPSSDRPHHMRAAFDHANAAVLDASQGAGLGSWACTLVLATYWRGRIVVGNVGDSRCYWLPDDAPARLLSTDDSLAQTRIELGVTRRVAESGAQAHAILKWLGPGTTDCEPSVQQVRPTSRGWLIACSDGLWNYASAPDEMRQVVTACLDELGAGTPDGTRPDAWELADRLTSWANAQGGRDNVSVGVVDVAAAQR